jgi:hypothetical protein
LWYVICSDMMTYINRTWKHHWAQKMSHDPLGHGSKLKAAWAIDGLFMFCVKTMLFCG